MQENRSEAGDKRGSNFSKEQKSKLLREFFFKKIGVMNKKHLDNLLKLGILGLDLEEFSVGIERRYEEMLVILKSNIETIRSYFIERLDFVQKEFNEKIMNEKH